jgi:hypothetical protein
MLHSCFHAGSLREVTDMPMMPIRSCNVDVALSGLNLKQRAYFHPSFRDCQNPRLHLSLE